MNRILPTTVDTNEVLTALPPEKFSVVSKGAKKAQKPRDSAVLEGRALWPKS